MTDKQLRATLGDARLALAVVVPHCGACEHALTRTRAKLNAACAALDARAIPEAELWARALERRPEHPPTVGANL